MRHIWKYAIILIFVITDWVTGYTQSYQSMKSKNPIVCYSKSELELVSVPPPEQYMAWRKNSGARTKSASFDVTYVGFTTQAQEAFQQAVDIWSSLISSPVTIHVTAVWKPLSAGVLGSAIWGSVHANFDGAQRANTWYPVALAEKMAGVDLNPGNDIDIYAEFSSTFNWYYGLDGHPTTNTYDLVTVVLHELGHGLGFVDSYYVSSGYGYVGAENTDMPMIYDLQLENQSGQNLYKQFQTGTKPLATQLTSGALFYNSPSVLAKNGNQRAAIFAPATFSAGSSISHLDEVTYPAGNINSLMTAQIGKQEAIHDPGPIVQGAFADIGWTYTRIQHQDLKDNEDVTGPYVVKAVITTDNGPTGTPQLHYNNGSGETAVSMTPTGNTDEYQATIPSAGVAATYGYYISVTDASGKAFARPGQLVAPGQDPQQLYTVFKTGPDTRKPVIHHTAPTYVASSNGALKLQAYVTDNLGVAGVTVEYTINDVSRPAVIMTQGTPDSLYTASIDLSGLANGAQIRYHIVAVDQAAIPNTAVDPETGDRPVRVVVLGAAQDAYVTNFENAGGDFFGEDFSVKSYTGFDNMALHTVHPYPAGQGTAAGEINITSQLRIPIRIKAQDATFIYDEVVLVEPGETGSAFGSGDFYDYVVVEGSKDGGTTWTPLTDGYDSRDNSAWLTRYNSLRDAAGNSTAVGDASLYRTRSLNLLNAFSAGDEVVLRFRLYSDALTTGWGWAIDNLYIQVPVVATELNAAADLKVFPNPVRSEINLSMAAALDEPITLTLINIQGQTVLTRYIDRQSQAWTDTWDLSAVGVGVYVLKVEGQNKQLIKKIVKTSY
jgi:hypothetical protein